MKKIFLGSLALMALSASAQKKTVPVKKTATPVKKTATPTPGLKNLTDSASYAIGISVANFYTQQGMKNINVAMVSKAINDVVAGKKPVLSEYDANAVIMRCINEAQEAKAKPTIASGQQFLAKNKTKAGVKTTESGLQYEVVTLGSGPRPTAEDSVTVHYAGTLLDGTEFDNSYKRGQPITFALSRVIAGWTEGLQLMPEGSKFKFYIPQHLGYGTNDVGNIPAGSVLQFEVELLKVIPNKNTGE